LRRRECSIGQPLPHVQAPVAGLGKNNRRLRPNRPFMKAGVKLPRANVRLALNDCGAALALAHCDLERSNLHDLAAKRRRSEAAFQVLELTGGD
jgi:hypothetical protein